MAAAMKHMVLSFAKLEKFKGVDFRRWQKKMHFMLFSMSVVYVLTTPMPDDGGENPTMKQARKRAKWDNNDYVCRGLILNDFKHTLKHLKEELTLIELGSHLRIKESLRVQHIDKPKGKNVFGPSVVNMVEHNNSSRYNDNKDKRKHHDTRANLNKKPKPDLAECARIAAFNLDDYQDDPEGQLHTTLEDMDSYPVVCLEEMAVFMTKWDVKSRVEIDQWETLLEDPIDELITRFRQVCEDAEIHTYQKCQKPGHLKKDCKAGNIGNRANGSSTKGSKDGSSNPLKGQSMFNKSHQFYYVTYVSEAFCMQDEDVAWVPNKRNKITPYELWSKKKPNLNYLRVWGCRAAVRLPDPKLKTLGKRGIECIFVGYAEHSKAFRFYVIEPNDSVAINSIIELMDAIFDEYMFSSVSRPSQRSLVKGTEDSGGSVVSERVTDEIDVSFWKEAINDGMDSMNNTWVLTDLPSGCRPLDCKWIFKRKPKVDGTIEKFKASFLEWGLEEEVYMNQPLGFIMPGNKNKMCKLIKSLYGLKQVLYKNMGEADVILGIRIKHESNGIAISQSHYIEKVLKKFNYSDCTPVGTPLGTCEKLMPNKGLAVSQLEYSRVIGCLMYAMTCTRPDIAFAVGKLSRLVYPGYPSVLEGFTDANWINNTEDSSTSGSMAGRSTATLAKAYSQMYNGKSRNLGVRHSMIRELIMNAVRAESHVLQNIPRMCLEPAGADPRLMDANGVRPVDMMVDSPKFHELLEMKDGVSCVILNFESNREYRVNPSLPDIIKSIYSTDEFMTYSYKVRSCPQAYSHDWTECPFAHPDEYLSR
nr:hypothetical protein [Tanacetum cinerariifolium]